MAQNDWKERLGVVFSTNPDYSYESEKENNLEETLPNNKQKLYVSIDRRNRGGKQVTLVKGFRGNEEELERLGKQLKTKCGTGGSVKDGEIIIQGDFRDKLIVILQKMDYQAKRGN
jgi:translation initiation factor 1